MKSRSLTLCKSFSAVLMCSWLAGAAAQTAVSARPAASAASSAVRPAVVSLATLPSLLTQTTPTLANTPTRSVVISTLTTPALPVVTLSIDSPPKPTPAATQGSAPVFSAPSFTPVARAEDAEPRFEPGQLLILWTSQESAAIGLAVLLSRYQQRPRVRYTLGSLGFTVAMLALPSDSEALALIAQLRMEQPEWVVDRNARSTPMQASSESVPRLYAQNMLVGMARPFTPPTAQGSSLHKAPIRLGVVDTGIDAALSQAAALNGSTITLRSVLGPADQPAATAHGNAVLQLMAGRALSNGFAGSAPPLTIAWASAMRELSGKPSTHTLSLVLALDWLLSQQVALINMSLGGQGDAVLKAAIERLQSKNIIIIAAAGNNPTPNAPAVYPAAYPGVWAITAVDAAGKLYTQAQRASYISMAAPGVELWIPEAGDSSSSAGRYVSGTSYAAALASAALAWQPQRFWALLPDLKKAQTCAQARPLIEAVFAGCGLIQQTASAEKQSSP